MSILEWAKREVELACQRENPNRKDGEFDYGCACYESALKAFESLCNDNHSGFFYKIDTDCVNIDNPSCSYHSGLVRSIIDKIYPITMPYFPGKPIKVFCEDFLTDKANGDFDTVGVLYALTEGYESKKNEIYRFFKESFDGWVEISKEEYEERKSKKIERT